MYIMYNYQKSKGSSDAFARFNASMITAFSVNLQLMLIMVVLAKVHYTLPARLDNTDTTNQILKMFSENVIYCLISKIAFFHLHTFFKRIRL